MALAAGTSTFGAGSRATPREEMVRFFARASHFGPMPIFEPHPCGYGSTMNHQELDRRF